MCTNVLFVEINKEARITQAAFAYYANITCYLIFIELTRASFNKIDETNNVWKITVNYNRNLTKIRITNISERSASNSFFQLTSLWSSISTPTSLCVSNFEPVDVFHVPIRIRTSFGSMLCQTQTNFTFEEINIKFDWWRSSSSDTLETKWTWDNTRDSIWSFWL